MSLRLVHPDKTIRTRNAKALLTATCKAIEECDNVRGFAIVCWDDRGQTYGSMRSGGPIATDLIPIHVWSALGRAE